jgi:hypothetical protein
MDRDIESIREEALSLNSASRASLLDDLSISLAEEPAYLDEWLDEAERRWKSIESGEAKTYSLDEVIGEARKRLQH